MELKKDLVSLVVPFYNAESYLERFLNSVLEQTYSNIQFILVNDGSTDHSEQIVDHYREKLDKKLSAFVYLKQNNGGAACAVNHALKYVEGEFLSWADSDDVLHKENIRFKYNYLKKNSDYGLVMCGAQAIDQSTGKKLHDMILVEEDRRDNIFKRIIEGIPCYPGVFMIRTNLLFDKLINREIYFNSEAGQNYQLLLPVAYDNKCGFITDILYDYYIRLDSHSHDVNYEQTYNRTFVREKLLDNILDFMPSKEKQDLMREIHIKSLHRRFALSFFNGDLDNNNLICNELKNEKSLKLKEKIKNFIIQNTLIYRVYQHAKRKK